MLFNHNYTKSEMEKSFVETKNDFKEPHAADKELTKKDLGRLTEISFQNQDNKVITYNEVQEGKDNLTKGAERLNWIKKQINSIDLAYSDYIEGHANQNDFLFAGEHSVEKTLQEKGYFTSNTPTTAQFKINKKNQLEYTEIIYINECTHVDEEGNYKEHTGPIATISVTSVIKIEGDKVQHDLERVNIKAHHEVAKEIFGDKRNFLERIRDLFSKLSNIFHTEKTPSKLK